MALSQSALLKVLDALKASDAEDVVRTALQVILQALIEAEATAVIGAGPHERAESRTGADRGGGDGGDRRRPARAGGVADRAAQRSPRPCPVHGGR